MKWIGVALLAAALGGGFLARPVCDPLDEEEVRLMNPPIYRRTSERTLWFKSYQIRNGRWCQCKPWVERALFF